MSKPIRIGYINACIAGDHRYSSRIEVTLTGDNKVKVELSECNASGGMDAPGGATPFRIVKTMITKVDAKLIVAAAKHLIDTESPSVIKAYGKPSKRFVWILTQDRGLAVKNVAIVLEQCKEAGI